MVLAHATTALTGLPTPETKPDQGTFVVVDPLLGYKDAHAAGDRHRRRARIGPLAVAVSAARTNDSYALTPLLMAKPAIKSRRGPRRRTPGRLHADKAYDQAGLRKWVRDRGNTICITRKGIESGDEFGRHRRASSAQSPG